jgi:hypothetical protein
VDHALIGGFADAAAIAIAIAGAMLVVRHMTKRRYARAAGDRTRMPVHAHVGRFNVSVEGACCENLKDPGAGRSAFGFTDPRDERLTTTVGIVAAVADGGGGPLTARIAIDEFLQAVRAISPSRASVAEILRESVTKVSGFAGHVADAEAEPNPVVALAAVAVTTAGLFWVSAGDVRVYLVRARVAHLVNRDRTPTSTRDAPRSPNGRAIDIAPAPLPLQSDDAIVLCSPSVQGCLNAAMVADTVVRQGAGSSRALASRITGCDRDRGDVSVLHLGIRHRGLFGGRLARLHLPSIAR